MMKVMWQIAPPRWFLARDDERFALEDRHSLERALSLLPVCTDEADRRDPPENLAGTARLDLIDEAAARITLTPQDARPDEFLELAFDEDLLVDVGWRPSAYSDGWYPARVELTAAGVSRVELTLFVPESDAASEKLLHVASGPDFVGVRDVALTRGKATSVLLMDDEDDEDGGGSSDERVFRLSCEAEPSAGGDDVRSLGFILVGTTCRAFVGR